MASMPSSLFMIDSIYEALVSHLAFKGLDAIQLQ